MTEIEVELEKADVIPSGDINEGVYLATFIDEDDRIVFFHCGKMIIQINVEGGCIQRNTDVTSYRNYKKIKNIKIKVELG